VPSSAAPPELITTGYWSPEKELIHETVNNWILYSGAFNPAYDSGDRLQPNDAAYQAMADTFGLSVHLHP